MVYYRGWMDTMLNFYNMLTDSVLFAICLFILGGSLYVSFKMKWVQLRSFPLLWQTIKQSFSSSKEEKEHTVSSSRALFTAMSTTLGISTLVGPVIAIQLGGPGALVGFLLASLLGSAVTYVEVCLGVKHRTTLSDGKVMGGPMQYLRILGSAKMAKFYALGGVILMMGWSAAQANQLASILDSPSLGVCRVSSFYSGIVLAALCLWVVIGGVKRVGAFSAKIVPVMFILYIGASLWIILLNVDRLGNVFYTIFSSVFSPYAMASGSLVGGAVTALRWGIFKGMQTTEAGVGTQTIPHSFAEVKDPKEQGALAMLSTFSAGSLAFLSGCVALLTNTWQDPSLPLGMSMVMASYEQYFSLIGTLIIATSALLFGFGTILGNTFNGSQCYGYLTENKNSKYYYLAMTVMIFLGAVGEVRMVWSVVDIIMAFIVVPHMLVLLKQVRKSSKSFLLTLERAV